MLGKLVIVGEFLRIYLITITLHEYVWHSWFILGAIGVLSFYFFSGRIDNFEDKAPQLNYYFVPIIIITLSTYFIADIFFGVYEMAVDTLFLCFLQDIEVNDGTPEKPYFMSRDLKKILGYMESKPSSPSKDWIIDTANNFCNLL